ncbi:MAG: hypothetical protein HWN81_10490 [Candidatus Lokiarchaeota archaeon]|nr:hypothetical protein [Candidatus Lokiarchaeota archaeon]
MKIVNWDLMDGFEFANSNANYRYNVKVDFYIKPVFRVEIETGGKDYYSSTYSVYRGYVYVSYYFGQPVVGASVELTIFNYMGELKKIIEGYTNGEGRFYFSINLGSIKDLDYSFSVEANVVDTYSRSASTKKMYTRIKDIFAYGYLSNWAPHPEETLEYYYHVYQYIMNSGSFGYWYWNYNPLANVSVKIEISGITNISEITYDLYSTGIHIFFPILPTGTIEITYQLQVDSIKNSYSGQCILWGMYDDIRIISQSIVLENIPRKYYSNNSIYQDLVKPSFSDISINQNDISQRIELIIKLRATDNNDIYKIRVIFSQISGWRAQTFYSIQNQEQFSFTLTDFKNIDSNVNLFLEIYDIYGNIATTSMKTIRVIEFIPYLIIGVIVGFSIGLAGLIAFLSKKFEDKKRIVQKDLIDKEERKISFLDPSEENNDDPQ